MLIQVDEEGGKLILEFCHWVFRTVGLPANEPVNKLLGLVKPIPEKPVDPTPEDGYNEGHD